MLALRGLMRGVDQIAAQLTDVLQERAALGGDVLPEAAHREALAHHDRGAADQGGAARDDPAYAVIHRQAVVEPVVRLHVDEAREPLAPLHEAQVTHVGGLRQARGAGGVDVERAVGERGRRALRGTQRLARQTRHLEVEARQIVRAGPVRRAADPGGEPTAHRRERARELGARNHVARRDDAERVRERLARQIGVDERDRGTDAAKAEPDRQVLRAVLHEKAHDIARGEAPCEAPAGVAVRGRGELAIAERALRAAESRGVREAHRKPLDQDGEGDGGIATDGGGALERADPRLERRSDAFIRCSYH